MIPYIETMTDNRSKCKQCAMTIHKGHRAIVFGSSAFGNKLSTAKVHLSCWIEKIDVGDLIAIAATKGGEHHEA